MLLAAMAWAGSIFEEKQEHGLAVPRSSARHARALKFPAGGVLPGPAAVGGRAQSLRLETPCNGERFCMR